MCGGLCKKGSGAPDDDQDGAGPPNAEHDLSLFERLLREERELRPPTTFPGLTGRRRRIRRLHSRTGFDVAVYPNGKVRGTMTPKNNYGSCSSQIFFILIAVKIIFIKKGFLLQLLFYVFTFISSFA